MTERIMDGGSSIKDKPQFSRRDFLRAASALTLSTFMAACAPKAVLQSPSELDPTKVAPTETFPGSEKVTSGVLTEITDKAQHDQIVAALPANRPEAKGGPETINTFKVTAGGRDFNFAGYDLTDTDSQKGIVVQLKDNNGNTRNITQTKALYAEYAGYDGKISYERLIMATTPQYGTDGKSTGEESVIWLYNQDGFPIKKGQPIDLTRPVLGYFVPLKSNSTVSFSPLISDGKLLAKYNVPNPITITPGAGSFRVLYVPSSGPLQGTFGEPIYAISTASPEPVKPLPPETEVSVRGVTFLFKSAEIIDGIANAGDQWFTPHPQYEALRITAKFSGDVVTLFSGPYSSQDNVSYFYLDDGSGFKRSWQIYHPKTSTITIVFGFKRGSKTFILHNELDAPGSSWAVDLTPLIHPKP